MTTWDKEMEIYDSLFAAQDIGGYIVNISPPLL